MKGTTEKTSRNKEIYNQWLGGKSFADIGRLKKYNLSRERIRQICFRENIKQQKSGVKGCE
jgi:Mor family transcriptional regulator